MLIVFYLKLEFKSVTFRPRFRNQRLAERQQAAEREPVFETSGLGSGR